MGHLQTYTFGRENTRFIAQKLESKGHSDEQIGLSFLRHAHDKGEADGTTLYISRKDGMKKGVVVGTPTDGPWYAGILPEEHSGGFTMLHYDTDPSDTEDVRNRLDVDAEVVDA